MLKTIKKLPHICGTFLRDALNKKYPLTHMLLPVQTEKEWLHTLTSALQGEEYFSVADILKKLDMGITSGVTGIETDIDLSAAGFPFIFDALNRIAGTTGEKIHVLEAGGTWRNLTGVRFKAWILRPSPSGYVELAIVNADNRLVQRFSINLWRPRDHFMEALAENAPIKRVRRKVKGTFAVSTDRFCAPVDVVYTWVNGGDPEWQALLRQHRELDAIDQDRFAQTDELKYSLRSLFTFAPWVRKVFIFSNCAPPEWFCPSERVVWIRHEEVIPEKYLPLFNSHAIETFLHLIPQVSERYIYFNDDVFLSGVVRPEDFFTPYGQSISRMESYGIVPFLEECVDRGGAEEWQCAAVNSARALSAYQGVYPTRLHQHTPHAFEKNAYESMLHCFPEAAEQTRRARFRQKTDYSLTSFLYHHFAASLGKAVHSAEGGMIVRPTNYKRFLARKIYARRRFFCINDGGGSTKDAGFQAFKASFPAQHYAFKSPAER